MRRQWVWVVALAGLLATHPGPVAGDAERTERFDRDPGWEGRNHRSTRFAPRTVRQDFGYSPTRHAGGRAPGEIGGLICPAAEPAYYARVIPSRTFDDRLSA